MSDGTCSDEGCNDPVHALGLCKKAYKRQYRQNRRAASKDLNALRGSPAEERFWSWVDRREPEECWPWKGFVDEHGYCRFYIDDSLLSVLAHRLAYILAVGPIPVRLQIDHMCHRPEECAGGDSCPHRRCCNPAHLEPATGRVNTLRSNNPAALNVGKTHCHRGHEFTPENTYEWNGGRSCRTCARERDRERIKRRLDRGLRADGKERQRASPAP